MAEEQSSRAIYEALAKVQDDLPELTKDSKNPHFGHGYLSLGKLLETVLPVFKLHGLLLLQPLTGIDTTPALTTIIVHLKSGQRLQLTTPLTMANGKQDAQGHAGASTYMRRYAIMSLLGLVAEDDDGNSASFDKGQKPQTAKPGPNDAASALDGGNNPF